MKFEFIKLNIHGLILIRPAIMQYNDLDCMIYFDETEFRSQSLQYKFKLEKEYKYSESFDAKGFYLNVDDSYMIASKGLIYLTILDDRNDSESYQKKCGLMLSDRNKWGVYMPSGTLFAFFHADNINVVHYKSNGSHFMLTNIDPQDNKYNIYWPVKEVKHWKKIEKI